MSSLRLLAILSVAFAISTSLPIISNEITEGSGDPLEGSGEGAKIEALLDSILEGSGIEGSGSVGIINEQVEGSGESVAAIITRLLSEFPIQLVEGSGESA